MGRRSSFERVERDFYPTPYEAVIPLLHHLRPGTRFVEPCAGDYRLARHIEKHGHECVYACDIEPLDDEVIKGDALKKDFTPFMADTIISNCPWDRKTLHPMIEHLSAQMPTWLLIDSNWMHTGQSRPYLHYCLKEVMIGRVKWIEGSKGAGKDDCSWFLFDQKFAGHPTNFFPKGWTPQPA